MQPLRFGAMRVISKPCRIRNRPRPSLSLMTIPNCRPCSYRKAVCRDRQVMAECRQPEYGRQSELHLNLASDRTGKNRPCRAAFGISWRLRCGVYELNL